LEWNQQDWNTVNSGIFYAPCHKSGGMGKHANVLEIHPLLQRVTEANGFFNMLFVVNSFV
jgi:hypothetical protein